MLYYKTESSIYFRCFQSALLHCSCCACCTGCCRSAVGFYRLDSSRVIFVYSPSVSTCTICASTLIPRKTSLANTHCCRRRILIVGSDSRMVQRQTDSGAVCLPVSRTVCAREIHKPTNAGRSTSRAQPSLTLPRKKNHVLCCVREGDTDSNASHATYIKDHDRKPLQNKPTQSTSTLSSSSFFFAFLFYGTIDSRTPSDRTLVSATA